MDLRLFIIEPEGLRRRMICDLAAESARLKVVGAVATPQFEDGAATAATAATAAMADMFVVNASLLRTDREGLGLLSRRYPEAYFVLYDSHPDIGALLSSAELPIRGYLSFNHLSVDAFTEALSIIAYGGAVIEPVSAQLLLKHLHDHLPLMDKPDRPLPDSGLTLREQEVLALVRKGLSNKEIARQMSISLGTVRAHLRNIFRKLDVTSRAGAAVFSMTPQSFTDHRRIG